MKLLLAIPTKFVGNLTIALATIRAAIDADYEVTLLIDDNFTDLLRLAVQAEARILSYPRRQLAKGSAWRRVRVYLQFLSRLRRDRYDTVLDLDGTVVSGRLVGLARAQTKIGPEFTPRKQAYQQLVSIDSAQQHCFDDYADMLQALEIDLPRGDYLLLPSSPEGSAVRQKLGLKTDQPVATINPNASAGKEYKQWTLAGFVALTQWLESQGWQVVIVGAGNAEQIRVDQLVAQAGALVVNACNRLSITELVALCQMSKVFIGNDSGPMHVATAAGCQVIALFGPSDSIRWNPKGDHATVLRGALPCDARCASERCERDYQCMHSLSLQQIQAEVSKLSHHV